MRWNTRGELEFLGRLDGQVKIRGCRIELGEIESVLQQHSAVRECLVQLRTDARGEPQLNAYVVRAYDDATTCAADLMAFARSRLPAWMVPAGIGLLDAWPLTPNGKIDREALTAATPVIPDAVQPLEPPRGAMEQTISHVWAGVIGHPVTGREANFFELGGHSLLAAQVVSRLNASLRCAISVRVLFEHPTLAGFAHAVEQQLESEPAQRVSMRRVKRRAVRPPLELVPPN